MARIDTLANFVTDIATAIKAKTGKTDPITPANFDTEIASIEGGGGSGKPSILPDGYTELAYIKSTGTQYIKTDLIVTEKTNFSATFRTYDGFTSSAFGCIFGTRYTYNANGYQLTTYPGNSSPYTGHFLFGGTRYDAGLIRDNLKQTASLKDGIFYRPDGETIDLTSVKTTPPSPMFIFAMCDTIGGDTTAYDLAKVALYSLSFEENGEFVANYVPAKRNDGVVGLYDTVSDKFYTNNGTGEFDYDELEYIESGGGEEGVYITDCSNLFDNASAAKSGLINKILPFCKPTTAFKMFFENSYIGNDSGAVDLGLMDMSQCESCESMFEYVPISLFNFKNGFDTSKVTNMQAMFCRSSSGGRLDLTFLDTSNATNMGWFLYNSRSISILDLSSCDFSKVTTTSSMFQYVGANLSSPTTVYVKDEAAQQFILSLPSPTDRPANWTTDNVVIKTTE